MSTLQRISTLSILGFAVSCGGGRGQANDPANAQGSQDAVQIAPGAQSIATGNLTPVSAPAELVAVGRLQNPARVVGVTSGWAKYPIDIGKMVDRERPGLSRVVKLDAPVEFALSLDPTAPREPVPFFVLSVGLMSLDEAIAFARDQGDAVDEIRTGVYSVSSGCIVAASLGSAPARLVCGDGDRDLDALGDYAARGLPMEALSQSDLYIEVRADPIRKLYGNQLRRGRTVLVPMILNEAQLGEPRFDRALADTVHALADEVLSIVDDLDTLTLEGNVRADAQVADAAMSLRFRGKKSWLAGTISEAGGRAQTAPDIFWDLPEDTGFASYSVGANPKRWDRVLATAIELMDGALANQQVPPRVRTQVVDLAKKLFITDAVSAYARGSLPADLNKLSTMSRPDREREMARSAIGWHVVGVAEPSKRWQALLDALDKTYKNRDLRRFLGKQGAPVKDLPTLRKRAARRLGGATTWELTLPPQTFESRWAPPGEKRAKGKALSFFLILMPDGDRTWMGLSADETLLVKKLAAVKKSAPDAGQLSSRSGLAKLEGTKSVGGGFFTLASWAEGAGPAAMALQDELGKEAGRLLRSMPNHGQTPMLHFTQVTPGAGPNLTVSATVPKEVLQDVVSAAMEITSMDGKGSGGALRGPGWITK